MATFCGDEKFQHQSDFISKFGSAQAQSQLNFLKERDSPYFRAWELLPMFNAVSRDLVNSHPRQKHIFQGREKSNIFVLMILLLLFCPNCLLAF